MNKKKKPVLQQVAVEDYAAEGKALSKIDGKVIFIEGAVPGDVVDVQLSKSKKEWGEGKAIHFHSLSPDRVTPSANILAFAAAANGKCFLMKNNYNINRMRWSKT